MLSTLKQLFVPSPVKQQAFDTYVRIVGQARKSVFYRDWRVEDTIDGRFDVIVLHLFLVISRCEEEAKKRIEAKTDVDNFVRYLSEAFFSDMDRSLREMGASDTGVGIRVKTMAKAFYGRLKAYKETIADESMLAEALKRNVYREKPVATEAVTSLVAYMAGNNRSLKLQSFDAIMRADINFLS